MLHPEREEGRRAEYRIVKINLGKRVRELRSAMGLSQEKLGLASGLDRTFINHIEHGRRNVTLESLHKLSLGLNMTLSELVENLEFKDPDTEY